MQQYHSSPNQSALDPSIFEQQDEVHATTGGSALAGAVTGGVIGTAIGPLGAAFGAVGGAIVGAITERVMHGSMGQSLESAHPGHWTDDGARLEGAPADGRFHQPLRAAERGSFDGGAQTFPVREEELRTHRATAQTGTVGVRRDVVTEDRSMDVPVTREEVIIDRHPVDRRPTDEPIRMDGETIRVPLHEEQVFVEKRPVVTEEVTIGKRQVRANQRISASVQREEVHVDRDGSARTSGLAPRPLEQPSHPLETPGEGPNMTPGYHSLEPEPRRHEHVWEFGRCKTCGAAET